MSLTDCLIPLGKGSRHNDIELRFCLRSIEKHLSNVGNIWIIGEWPEWLHNIVHVPCQDNPNNWNRARNIYTKIIKGCQYEAGGWLVNGVWCEPDRPLSDNFLFMNDDHFLLQDYDAGEFPYYHRGVIDLPSMTSNIPQYTQMYRTLNYFNGVANDFDVHCPIVFNKRLFSNLFNRLPQNWPEYGYGIKSFYANHGCDITKEVLCEDLKFSQPAMRETIYRVLDGRPWFSIGDRCLKNGDMLEVLRELYPNKSKYEL